MIGHDYADIADIVRRARELVRDETTVDLVFDQGDDTDWESLMVEAETSTGL